MMLCWGLVSFTFFFCVSWAFFTPLVFRVDVWPPHTYSCPLPSRSHHYLPPARPLTMKVPPLPALVPRINVPLPALVPRINVHLPALVPALTSIFRSRPPH
ncbi:hypothetical protein BC829DRAFT_77328 [Chytridium lagenaria]|nr:hypothetical protein BC829DRAFT_77328 [Chytridium lagenaria]